MRQLKHMMKKTLYSYGHELVPYVFTNTLLRVMPNALTDTTYGANNNRRRHYAPTINNVDRRHKTNSKHSRRRRDNVSLPSAYR